MKVTIVGTGYVGLTEGLCFAEVGHNVTCVDINEKIIKMLSQGIPTLYEENLEEMLKKNLANGRIKFTTSLEDGVKDADVILTAVNTPENPIDGSADLRAVFAVSKDLATKAKDGIVVVTRSTVPVGTNKKVEKIIKEANPSLDFHIASNPEFSKQGSAIQDFLYPDRVIVGVENDYAKEKMNELYAPIVKDKYPILFTNLETAELIKYASNSFLAVKIGFINEMANICEKVGADVSELADAMGLDSRIERKFLNAGPGYGGSCFPKDTSALVKIAESMGLETPIVKSTLRANKKRKVEMAHKIASSFKDSDVKGQRIAILGVAFKANTDDTRSSPALPIIEELHRLGAELHVYDPQAMEKAKDMLPKEVVLETKWHDSVEDATNGAGAVAIITGWDEFKTLDLKKLKDAMNGNIIVDLRNVLEVKKVKELGFIYDCIGKRV